MARIRSIKPEIRTSEKVAAWPIAQRFFWIMLWGYCDDFGRGKDNARLIWADSFPLDDEVAVDDIEQWMTRFADDGVIERYEVDRGRYFRIVNWTEHQKVSHPAKSVIPCPHGVTVQGHCEAHDDVAMDSGKYPEGVAKVSGEAPPRAGSRERGAGSGGEPADAGSPPPRRCPNHLHDINPPNCIACRNARLELEDWQRAQKQKPTPQPRDDPAKYCPTHPGYVLEGPHSVCARCEREAIELAVAS